MASRSFQANTCGLWKSTGTGVYILKKLFSRVAKRIGRTSLVLYNLRIFVTIFRNVRVPKALWNVINRTLHDATAIAVLHEGVASKKHRRYFTLEVYEVE